MKSESQKIARNTLYNSAGKLWNIGVNLVIIPYIIHRLGIEQYGLWALAIMVGVSFTMVDFGMFAGMSRFIAQSVGSGSAERMSRVVVTGLLLYLIFISTVALLLLFAVPFMVDSLFQVPVGLRETAFFVLRLSLLLFLLTGLSTILHSMLHGIQRMDVANGILVGVSIVQAVATVIVLESGWGLTGLIGGQVVAAFLSLLANGSGVVRLIPSVSWSIRFADWELAREMVRFGWKLQVVSGSGFLTDHLNKVFVTAFAGLSGAGLFDVSIKILTAVRLLPLLLFSALVPPVAEYQAKGMHEHLRQLYARGTKYTIGITFPVVVTALLATPSFVALVFGPEFDAVVLTVQVLAIAYAVNLLTGMGTSVGRGIGKPELEMQYALLVGLGNIGLVQVFGSVYGYFGVIAGMAISIVAGSIYYLWRFHTTFQGIVGGFQSTLGRNLIPASLPALFVLGITFGGRELDLWRQEIAQWWNLSLAIIIVPIYILFMYRWYFDEYDRRFVASMLPFRIKATT
ncbi:MAG TPA: oligosaccharide flippase family protein [Bacteroidota bacterium]|nr:oligosaccharide flippase family protein [Bacteroidota bacterium]